MPNSYVSTVYINSQTYYLKDSEARTMLSNVYTKSETDTAIAEAIGTVTGLSFEVVQSLPPTGQAGVIYLLGNGGTSPNIYDEYVWLAASTSYEKIGTTDIDLSGYAQTADLGDLAYKDSASGSFTPSGSVTINSYTPEGSVSVGKITPSGSVSIDSFTPAGSISVGSGTANYTPAGSVTVNAYTPEGECSAPTITVTPTTTTVNSITAVGSLPTWGASVNNEVLSFSWSQGSLPTKGDDTTVMTGASASSSAPAFTGSAKAPTGSFSGTAVNLKFTGTQVNPSGSFSGTEVTPSASFTGTAKAPTGSFSGTADTVTVS